jgi:hypothetical protein
MASLIVIRIVPPASISPVMFRTYLGASGGLKINAYQLDYGNVGNQPPGQSIGSASYIDPVPPGGWSAAGTSLVSPSYPSGVTSGIFQQVDYIPPIALNPAIFQLEAVATAIIELSSAAAIENLRLELQYGAGPATPVALEYYDVALDSGATPDLSSWTPSQFGPNPQPDLWASLSTTSLFLTLTPAPSPNRPSLQLSSDGSPPAFDALLTAVTQVLAIDPGGSFNVADLGAMTIQQCQNLAYEILWSQQPSLPSPREPLENLYTDPPNDGNLLDGGNPNQDEADRRQFEAQLQSYYAMVDANADRLTNYVFALCAAVACEQMSLAATQALLEFPAILRQSGGAPLSPAQVVLTGFQGLSPALDFGAPAAYFYALDSAMPTSVSAKQRFAKATTNQLQTVLNSLTSAWLAQTITDDEAFVTVGGSISAAQAARRIHALGTSSAATIPLAPLGAFSLPTSATTTSGDILTFASTAAVSGGLTVNDGVTVTGGLMASGANIAADSLVSATPTPTTVQLNKAVTGPVPAGGSVVFSPVNPPQLHDLVQSWLAFPPAGGVTPSSLGYQASDDADLFWPGAAQAQPLAFLNLALSALTQGFILPPPFNEALGSEIVVWLKTGLNLPQTIDGLASVTTQQWNTLFTRNPTWAPGQQGDAAARAAAFLQYAKKYFAFASGGPQSSINLATNGVTPSGTAILHFASTAGVEVGMRVSSPGPDASLIPAGAMVQAPPAPNSVELNVNVTGALPFGTNITFTPSFAGASVSSLPLLPQPADDLLAKCLASYDPAYALGGGISDPSQLAAAAAALTSGDEQATAWLVDAVTTIDALYQIIDNMAPPPTPAGFAFSIVEALYARGVKSAADVTKFTIADFPQALVGTIAFDPAESIYAAASLLAPPIPVTSAPGSFQPINPDGSLVNCIPPPCRSPLGPIAYLNEMLQVSEASTCEKPLTPASTKTLGAVLAGRRGPLGQLAASCANLETPLPLIDIVNENLESLGSNAGQSHGIVFDASADALAGFPLCRDKPCPEEDCCHDPETIFGALPEHSTPVTRTSANGAIDPPVYEILKSDFSCCQLPYSQPLDVNRAYVRHFGSRRFEEMRCFRKCITEFVLDPDHEPDHFDSYLWRYPVRIDIAIEYLGLSPEEYALLFQGSPAHPCAAAEDPTRGATPVPGAALSPAQLYGFTQSDERAPWTQTILQLPEFLARTCLTYCEFIELWKSGFVVFNMRSNDGNGGGDFPECEPCCLDRLWLQFPEAQDQSPEASLAKLAIFIRLWRKLKGECCEFYSFARLRDICEVLRLFEGSALNPDFIRQLAAFKMLCDAFDLPLSDPDDKRAATAVDADRTQILALWAQPRAAKWPWAVRQLIEHIGRHALHRHHCERRAPEFIKLLAANLDPLSRLAGFDPDSATDNWHALPTHTLRFAEILAKIYASDFSIGEILYLFTAQEHLDGDDPFALQPENEALDSPLDLPDDSGEHSLWRLRAKLLDAEAERDDDETLGWKRIEAELQSLLGFAAADARALGAHFFPGALQKAGYPIDEAAIRFVSNLPAADTTSATWNIPPDGPFQYDSASQQLWTRMPLNDRAVTWKLTHAHDLSPQEQAAVQDLYFQPRAVLARFALLFSDFAAAEKHMIETCEESERWDYFHRQFSRCRRRCHIIAEHLADHVAAAMGRACPEGAAPALLILRETFADENELAGDPSPSWENDDGGHSPVIWTPRPNGGAFAALLALTGTGLIGEYSVAGGPIVWRDVCGRLEAFGAERDKENCPVPTVLPAMDAAIAPGQLRFVTAHNGFLMQDATGAWLGGAQGFAVQWSGALLVDCEGAYEFWAGAPTPEGERPDVEAAEPQQWRVTIRRGQREWILLTRRWPCEEERRFASMPLKRGAYDLVVELVRPTPEFCDGGHVCPQHTGFQLKYAGPDSDDRRVAIPHEKLFCVFKDKPLSDGVATLGQGAATFLNQFYVGSLRDARRTYQRAFKALLFAVRFALSAHRRADGDSELGYMLSLAKNFAGASYYRSGPAFLRHSADFDFNYLPVLDNYHPQNEARDSRVNPSPQRIQAMFDWWERVFDYAVIRRGVRHECGRHLWFMFDEAEEKKPAHPDGLLRHMGVNSLFWPLELHYFQGQFSRVFDVTGADLQDERWAMRVWRADRWLRAMQHFFALKDITKARPDLWASDDPGALVFGETQTGNANLIAFVCEGALDHCELRRYEEVKRLDDHLRLRGRDALLAYLCHGDRVQLPWPGGGYATVPRDLSDLLLLDVECGLCERASRIEEAIAAAQSFIRRARLGLEPGWAISAAFAQMWDREFASFHVWQACKRRLLYKEDWIEWGELAKARRVEAFRFLEGKLRNSELTLARPGALEWWPDEKLALHQSLELLQKREVSQINLLGAPREGLNLIGTPERDARPSWLAAVGQPPAQGAPQVAAAPLPAWMQAAIRMGARFVRVAAAGAPPSSMEFKPNNNHAEGCVSCCTDCDCDPPAVMDEYYFWLIPGRYYDNPAVPPGFPVVEPNDGYQYGFQDDFYDPVQQQAAYWEDPTQLPHLLDWPTVAMVRLAWCRLRNGEFQQPRRSHFGVAVNPGDVDLAFVQRVGDSLYFSVSNAITPVGYADTTHPGFRYDLAEDGAVTLPLVATPQPDPSFVNALLPAYPYFAFVAPGAPLHPLSPFAPAIAIARALRAHCRFEAALKWYRRAFDPLASDCAWTHCPESRGSNGGGLVPVAGAMAPASVAPPPPPSAQSACCDGADVSCAQAENRSIVLLYLETLREWGDATIRRRHSPESFQQARVIFDAAKMILGERPDNIRLPEPTSVQTVDGFKPEFAPLNPRLLELYEVVHDRLRLIHECLSARRLHGGAARRDMPYFGDTPSRQGWRDAIDACADESDWCKLHSPYRFSLLIQKAQDYAARAQELGGALLAAFEKGDAEYLAALRAQHERELFTLGLASKEDQWRDADWQVEALRKTKAVSQANLAYYSNLIQNGLIGGELAFQDLTSVSTDLRAASNAIEASGEAANGVGNFFDGVAGFGGTPLIYEQLPIGEPLGHVFAGAARVMNSLAEIASSTAGLDLTQAGWQRRNDEWVHQTQILAIEIQQTERQILAAQRRRDQMLVDLNSFRRQMEQSAEVQNFLRDKFTAHDLYLYLQRETASLYYQTYELALYAARQAERAFNLERGHTTRRFIPDDAWDNLREGLLAGDRLSAALRHMDHCYLDENIREYELTKHLSLRRDFPIAFLRLRTTGYCEIEIPEWMFDLDFPGQYMRRIRNVSLTIPCVAGPYSGVHCRLTLIDNVTRIDPRLIAPPHGCCCPPKPCSCRPQPSGYELCVDDPRMVRIYGAREAIATSGGQNDFGLFELNFNDPRYLPFEYMGAVSRWRIELPPEDNYFDLNSLTDTILHLNYTAREGGEGLRQAARVAAQEKIPGDGWAFFDITHDFPDAWELFRRSCKNDDQKRELAIPVNRNLLPFLPGDPEVRVTYLVLLFETAETFDRSGPEREACPCPERKITASHRIEFRTRTKGGGDCMERSFDCVADTEWRMHYQGVAEADLRLSRRDRESREIEFCFPKQTGEILRVYLFCHYEKIEECCTNSGAAPRSPLNKRRPSTREEI